RRRPGWRRCGICAGQRPPRTATVAASTSEEPPMIKKFDSSYYGTADMENLGYKGTPINDRCYSREQLAKAMHKVVDYAKCMDQRGYNTLWMAEHPFKPEGI